VPETTLRLATATPAETRELAAVVARHLDVGDVVTLAGDLGAGKTCFVQGAAAELGVEQPVTSPTYVLVKLLAGRVPVVHVDVYRLERLRDVDDLGEDVFAPDVVTFVEWGDMLGALLPPDRLEITLRHAADDGPRDAGPRDDGPRDAGSGGDGSGSGVDVEVVAREDGALPRAVTIRAVGEAWGPRAPALVDACEPWRERRPDPEFR